MRNHNYWDEYYALKQKINDGESRDWDRLNRLRYFAEHQSALMPENAEDEHAVVNTYKRGKLDKQLLACFMETYRDSDIDSGGKVGLFVVEFVNGEKRIMEVEDIVIKVMTGQFFAPPKLPKDYKKWTPGHDKACEAYHDKRYDGFRKITRKFGRVVASTSFYSSAKCKLTKKSQSY